MPQRKRLNIQRNNGKLNNELKAMRKELERIQQDRPFVIRIPAVPPLIDYTFQVNRIIEIFLIQTPTPSERGKVFGTPSEPTKFYTGTEGTGAAKHFSGSLTFYDILKSFNVSFVRRALRADDNSKIIAGDVGKFRKLPHDAFNLFKFLRLNSVKMWGPAVSGDFTAIPIEMAVGDMYLGNSGLRKLTAGAVDYATDPILVRESQATARDTGSRTQRSHCGISIPQPKWISLGAEGGIDDTTTGNMNIGVRDAPVVFYEIGFRDRSVWEAQDGTPIALFHLSISGILTRESTPDENVVTLMNSFESDNLMPDEFLDDIEVLSLKSSTGSRPDERIRNARTLRR